MIYQLISRSILLSVLLTTPVILLAGALEARLKELDGLKKPLPDVANQIRTALGVIR